MEYFEYIFPQSDVCTCGEYLGWHMEKFEKDKHKKDIIQLFLDMGLEKMCCHLNFISSCSMTMIDCTSDAYVDKRTSTIKRAPLILPGISFKVTL